MVGKRTSKLLDRTMDAIPKLMIAFVLLFLLLPLVITFVMSFASSASTFPPSGFSLKWYGYILTSSDFMDSLRTSLFLGASAIMVSLLIGIPASLVMVRHNFKGKQLLETLFLSPMIIPGVILGVSLLELYGALSLYNPFVELLIAHIIITLPYVVRVVSASLIGFDRSLEEAAMNLGANEIQTFTQITLPIIKTGILAAAIFAFQVSFNDVSVTTFLTSVQYTTLPVMLLAWTYHRFDPSVAAISGVVFFSIIFILLVTERLVGMNKLIGAFSWGT